MNWRKAWYFIWKEDSWSSWIVNVILAIIIVKFLIYPGLGFLLGTGYPVVAVVSCSMQHDETNCWADCYMRGEGSLSYCLNKKEVLCGKSEEREYWELCGEWYEKEGITKEEFLEFPQNKGFNIGDIFVLTKASKIKKGDVIVYNNYVSKAPIIHRIVNIEGDIIKTKGDFNSDSAYFEQKIKNEQVYGKVLLKIPYLGWVKIAFNMLLKTAGII